jgi:hypothetical protein
LYLDHFGLSELPFGITPDTSFTVITRSHQEALNTLLVALNSGEGFIKITGEVGTGKSLLCRRLLQALPENAVSAYLPNPYLAPRTLLLALAEELGVAVDSDSDDYHLQSVNRALLAYAGGRQVVVCIDEAQAMPLETLESLRLLSNLETEKRKLLQIVLFGQPELDRKLASHRCASCCSASLSITAWGLGARKSATTWRTACGWPATGATNSSAACRAQPAPGQPRHAAPAQHPGPQVPARRLWRRQACRAVPPRAQAAADTEGGFARLVVR